LRKGSKVYVEGSLEYREFEVRGEKKIAAEIVLRPFSGELTMLDRAPDAERPASGPAQRRNATGQSGRR
jgi:single-stranded DNA-binding protein